MGGCHGFGQDAADELVVRINWVDRFEWAVRNV